MLASPGFRFLIGALSMVAFIAALTGCTAVAGLLSGGATDALESGGVRELRPTLRPIRGETRVLIIALDGVGDNDLRGAVEAGAVPRIAALLGPAAGEDGLWTNAYAVPDVVSIFPAVTIGGWTQLFTGRTPAETGIPGGEWFDRDSVHFYAPVPLSISATDHTVDTFDEDLVNRSIQTPTLYEQLDLRSHVSFSQVFRGADLFTTPDRSDLLGFVGGMIEGLLDDESVEQEVYKEMDEQSIDSVIDAIETYGLPDIQTVYFPGVDLYTHSAENPIDAQREYLGSVIDPAVGEVIDAYQKRRALDRTYVIFVADHGHTPVLKDDLHALTTDGDNAPPNVLRQAGFRVRPFVLEVDSTEQSFQAVMAYQDGAAYVYLADRSSCPDSTGRCDWSLPPRLEEDVLPVARAFFEASDRGESVPTLQGTLDLVLARRPPAPNESPRAFEVFDGDRLVPVEDYLGTNPRPDLVRLAERLRGLTDGPYGDRAGDVLLLARSSAEVPIEERFYFSPPHRSGHGGAGAEDSIVPMLVARRGESGVALRQRVRSLVGADPTQRDLVPLVQGLLEVESTPGLASTPSEPGQE